MFKISFFNLSINEADLITDFRKVLDSVASSGQITNSHFIEEFENIVKNDSERKFSVALSSGTAAVWVALRLANVGPGDEVITSCLGWLGTINPIFMCGAIPIFVDIGNDLNIDISSARNAITSKTKAILAVHYTGLPCDIEGLLKLCREHRLALIEDCAQAYGAKVNGKPVGSFGDVAAFSMNPMKIFASLGECGAVSFDCEDWLIKAQSLRHNGLFQAEHCLEPSLNNKPDAIQCGFLVARRSKLQNIQEKHKEIAELYNKELYNFVTLPVKKEGRVYYTYAIQAEHRDDLQDYLRKNGIETKIRHPILFNEQESYIRRIPKSNSMISTPVAKKIKNHILNLPIYEKMSEEDVLYVCSKIKSFYNNCAPKLIRGKTFA